MRRKLVHEGQTIDGEDITFRIVEDGFVTLELADGARLNLRPVVVNVVKTNEKPGGERLYVVQHLVHVSTETPAKEDRE